MGDLGLFEIAIIGLVVGFIIRFIINAVNKRKE